MLRKALTSARTSFSSFFASSSSIMPLQAFWVGAGLPYSVFLFCLVGQYLEMCPFFWHLKHPPVSCNFCFSSSVRGLKPPQPKFPALMSMALGLQLFWWVLTPSHLARAWACGESFFLLENSWVCKYLSYSWCAASIHPLKLLGGVVELLMMWILSPLGSPCLNNTSEPCSVSKYPAIFNSFVKVVI